MVTGQVPPDDVTQDGQQSDHSAVEGEGNRIRRIRAEDGRDEGDQGDSHEEQDAQPYEGPVHANDEVKRLMVCEPEDTEDDEADDEGSSSSVSSGSHTIRRFTSSFA